MPDENGNFFLVIEGLDGSGKTELARQLTKTLEGATYFKGRVLLTFEPHDPSCSGLFIRQVLTKRLLASPRTLALAFAANRADHLEREIGPFLNQDGHRVVISDRYYLSSLVYQTTPTLSMEEVMMLNSGVRQPDLTLFLNASTKTCNERMRRRQENKELFEKNLAETRQKYETAIQFLRKRGELIIEVNADGTISQVLNDAIDILEKHGRDWLTIQRLLLEETSSEVFSLNGENHESRTMEFVSLFSEYWRRDPITSSTLRKSLTDLKDAIEYQIAGLSLDDLGSLFLGYVVRSGLTVIERLPEEDLCAYELEYIMPLGVQQRGTAFLLAPGQRYDLISKKTPDLRQLSDFMLVLDPGSPHLVDTYYERDRFVHSKDDISISPSVRVIYREDILKFVLSEAIVSFYTEYNEALQAEPVLSQIVMDLCEQWGILSETLIAKLGSVKLTEVDHRKA